MASIGGYFLFSNAKRVVFEFLFNKHRNSLNFWFKPYRYFPKSLVFDAIRMVVVIFWIIRSVRGSNPLFDGRLSLQRNRGLFDRRRRGSTALRVTWPSWTTDRPIDRGPSSGSAPRLCLVRAAAQPFEGPPPPLLRPSSQVYAEQSRRSDGFRWRV